MAWRFMRRAKGLGPANDLENIRGPADGPRPLGPGLALARDPEPLALAVSGFVILMAHPRLYWGNAGNDLTPALVELPISRNYKHGG